MDEDSSCFPVYASDFGFAINNQKFSDRVLRIEIVPDDENRPSLLRWECNCKRKRQDAERQNAMDAEMHNGDGELNIDSSKPDTSCCIDYDDDDEWESPPIRKTNLLAVEAANIVELNSNDSSILKVKYIHISSIILAAKSTYFYELFNNETRESEDRPITLKIHASEEAALMDLLGFMYSNTLSTSTISGLLDVLVTAAKYKSSSCMNYCSKLLEEMPLTCGHALFYLDLPSIVGMVEAVKPLVNAAKDHFSRRYQNLMKYQNDLLEVPLSLMELVISSDDLEVDSEDDVYEFVVKWVNLHHSNSDKRREVMTMLLSRLIRFQFMSCQKLREVLAYGDFDDTVSTNLVIDALLFKTDPSYRLCGITTPVERDYKYLPVRVVEIQSHYQLYHVYFSLHRLKCTHLFPDKKVYSDSFDIRGESFFLSAFWIRDRARRSSTFALFLEMQVKEPLLPNNANVLVQYNFLLMTKPNHEFISKHKDIYRFTRGKSAGCRNMFELDLRFVMNEETTFLINDAVHMRVDLLVTR